MRTEDAKATPANQRKQSMVTHPPLVSRRRAATRARLAATLTLCLAAAWHSASAQVAQLQFTPAQLNAIAGTGTGTANDTGDGGPALSATFDAPIGAAQDASGNIYVVDQDDNYVRKIDIHGTITAFAGIPNDGSGTYSGDNGQATAANLSQPIGIAIDSSGNVYIADYGNFRIRKVVPSTGIITTYAGIGNGHFTGANAPNTVVPGPEGIAFDPSGNLYIACTNSSIVMKITPAGVTTIVAGVINTSGGGTPGYNGDNILANTAEVNFPDTVATDQSGNVYIADTSNNRIRKITVSTGMITTVAGNGTAGNLGDGAAATSAEINAWAVTTDLAGDLFISSYNPASNVSPYATIRKVDVNGNITTIVGGGTGSIGGEATAASINSIGFAGVDNNGSILIPAFRNPDQILSSGPTGYLQFGNQSIGIASAPQTVIFENTGNAKLTFSQTTYSATAPFTVTGGTCTGLTSLASGATCTLTVTFTPPLATSYTGSIAVNSNGTIAAQTITLAGTGVSTPAPAAALTPSPVAFGNQTINTTSSPSQIVVLMNTGNATLTGISISVTGTNANAFGMTSACGTTLAAGVSCNISLNFTPTTIGANSASLSVSDNASNSPQSVTITGTGLAANVVAPAPFIFNPAPVGISLASAQTLTATFQVNGFAAGFTPTAQLHYGLSYSIGNVSCTGAAGSETCSVPITFQPQYPGGRREALFLMNGTTRLATLLIYGVGQGPFAMVQPGVVTSPILSGANYYYTSIVDENGTVYVLGDNSNTVFTVTKAGVVGTLPITGLNSPRGIGIDGAGVLYIADQTYNGPTITYDTAQSKQGSVPFPAPSTYIQTLAVGNTGNIYETNDIDVYTLPVSGTGTAATIAINPAITQGSTMTVDSSENVFIGGYTINEITSGGVQTEINTVGSGDGIGVDAADTVYATRYTLGGVAELPASSYGTALAYLDPTASPLGMSVGPDGTVYVGNYTNLDKVDRTQGLIAFGEQTQTLGTAGTQQIVTIYNGGNQTLTISNIAITGAPFSIQTVLTGTNCANGNTIAPGALCQIGVVVTPVHAGVFSGSITVTSNSLNNASTTQTIALTAFAYGVYVTPSPTTLTFPNQIVNTTSTAQTITLTNNGDLYNAGFGTPTFSSPGYSVSLGNCSSGIAVGASCNLSVTFTPTAAQTYNNITASIPYSSSGGGVAPAPVTFTLNGTGIPASAPQAVLSPNPLTFPSTTPGTSGTSLPLTLSNPGNVALTISSISVTGTNASSFTQSNNCGASLTVAASCTILVNFSPASTGSFTASISVADNASGSPHTAALTGTGIKFVSNVGTSLAAQAVTVDITTAGTLGAIQTLTQGATGLDFTSAPGGTCATGTAYTAGQSCTVDIIFTPAYAGSRYGGIVLANAGGTVLGSTHLNGTGNGPQMTFLPNTPTTLGGAFSSPYSVAVNGNGNVFVANTAIGKVEEIPSGCTSSSCVINLGSGFSSPTGIALDGFGNVYVTDAGLAKIEEILAVNGSIPATPSIITLTNDFNFPFGIAVDGNGNVYLSDEGTGSVYEMLAVGGTIPATPTVNTLSSSFNDPAKVAVDANGNVYVADQSNNAVKEILAVNGSIPSSPTIKVLGSGFSAPAGIALDGSGDVYVSDSSNNQIKAIMQSGGSIPASPSIVTLASSLGDPLGDAVAGNGNVYFASYTNNTVGMLNLATPPSFSFASTSIGSTSTDSPKTVSVQNIGNAALSFSSIVASTNFKLDSATTTCSTSTPIAAGSSCAVGVDFVPTATGSLPGTLVLTDNNLNGFSATQTISLTGTGAAASAPVAGLSPNPLAFPNTNVGSTATALPVTLSNTGNATLTGIAISITGTNPGDFATTPATTCGTTLAASTSCLIYVSFTPASATGFNATLSVTDNATGSPQTVALTGTGTTAPAPQATLSPNPVTFPNTNVGSSSGTMAMALSNPGNAALTISSISITGSSASSFSQTNNCGASVAASASCTITVTFTPAATGSLSASISVADNATGSPHSATITGTGTAPQAVLSPNPLAFPSTTVGAAATALPMTLSNPGTSALTISGISVTGTNASSFRQTNNCPASLAAGATCTINVVFTPASAASLTAAISIADNATGSPQSAPITGTGTAPLIPQAVLTPNPLAFASTTINTSATPLPMTLSNPGNTALAISSIAVTGANASSFGQTNTCGASLAAGASCTITVGFTPTSAATFTAAIAVTDNAAGSPQSAAITGIGSAGSYTVSSSNPSQSVQPGAVAQFSIQVNPLGGTFNNLVTLSATGLPTGAQVSFLPPAVTPGSAGAPSVMSIQTSTGLARLALPKSQRQNPVPLLALLAGIPLLGFAGSLRRLRQTSQRWMLLGLAALAILPMLALSGCGGGYFGPNPQTFAITVTGTSGALQESTTISLTVQ